MKIIIRSHGTNELIQELPANCNYVTIPRVGDYVVLPCDDPTYNGNIYHVMKVTHIYPPDTWGPMVVEIEVK